MVRPSSSGDVSRRVMWLRAILLSGTFCGMLSCMPLWMNGREYPLLPAASWVPVVLAPWDKILFVSLLALLALAGWFYQIGVILFLLGSLFLVLADQNRAQPWFYMNWVMLLLSLAPVPVNLAACRAALAAVYVWGGIQKCNPNFFKVVVPWFVDPVSKWFAPGGMEIVQWVAAAAPFVEIFIGLALWLRFTRILAIIAALGIHAAILLFLGPLGRNYNLVIWPWNLGMIALVLILFPRARIAQGSDLKGSFLATAIVILFWLLPILGFFGKWPSYLSFAAYSGNLATGDMFVTDSFRERLPEEMRSLVQPTEQPFNPSIQGPYFFDHQRWALKELGVPPIPEPQGFLTVGRYLVAKYAAKPYEMRVIIAPRYGPTVMYQGSQSWLIVPNGK